MKRTYISLIIIVLAMSVIAQAPLSFKYQAYLRNADGTIRGSEFVTLQIKIVRGTVNGAAVYTEVHNTSTNAHGLVSVNVGDGSSSNNMATLQWGVGPYFLDITVNGIHLGTTELLSVPFALFANETGDSFSGAYSDLSGRPNLATVATTGRYTDLVSIPSSFNPISHTHTESQISNLTHYTDADIDGTEAVFLNWDQDVLDDFSGSFADLTDVPITLDLDSTDNFVGDMGGLPITNLGTPINPTDAATMAYVDASSGFSGSFNDLTDVPITLDLDSTNNLPVDYIDLINSPTQIGNLGGDMLGLPITNLGAPINPTDAATRGYVDASSGFSGVYTDLTFIPTTFTPDVHTHAEADITDLTHYTDADIDGTEAAFTGWDTNAANDFAGDMGNARITNVGAPTAATDAATRAYVDASSGSFSGSYLDLSNVPTNIDEDATDDFDGDYTSLTNVPLEIGDFVGDMGNARITNLGTPTAATDAATMAYVDLLEAKVDALQDALDALTVRVAAIEP